MEKYQFMAKLFAQRLYFKGKYSIPKPLSVSIVKSFEAIVQKNEDRYKAFFSVANSNHTDYIRNELYDLVKDIINENNEFYNDILTDALIYTYRFYSFVVLNPDYNIFTTSRMKCRGKIYAKLGYCRLEDIAVLYTNTYDSSNLPGLGEESYKEFVKWFYDNQDFMVAPFSVWKDWDV